jgi:hypothetical protein
MSRRPNPSTVERQAKTNLLVPCWKKNKKNTQNKNKNQAESRAV